MPNANWNHLDRDGRDLRPIRDLDGTERHYWWLVWTDGTRVKLLQRYRFRWAARLARWTMQRSDLGRALEPLGHFDVQHRPGWR